MADQENGGHAGSRKLREDAAEVAAMQRKQADLFDQGRAQFDELYAAGSSQLDEGEPARARECFVTCYLLAREIEYSSGEADALAQAALCYERLGDGRRALELLQGSSRLHAVRGDARGGVVTLGYMARMHAAQHQLSEALEVGYQVAADAAYNTGSGMSSNYANGEVVRYPAAGATMLVVVPGSTITLAEQMSTAPCTEPTGCTAYTRSPPAEFAALRLQPRRLCWRACLSRIQPCASPGQWWIDGLAPTDPNQFSTSLPRVWSVLYL